jgi:hypothetical protein
MVKKSPTDSGGIRVRPESRRRTGSVTGAAAFPCGYRSTGAIAGAVAAFVFTVVHDLTISNIWWMLGPMLVAGAVSGLCIAWTYGRLFPRGSIISWVVYNAAYLAMFGVLAVVSVVVFEPVTTMAAISAESGPVDDLIVRALPLTGAFTLVTTGVLGGLLARVWSDYLRLMLVVTVLVVFLGLNVAVLGFIEFSDGSLAPVVAFFGLIVLLDLVFAAVFALLQGSRLLESR